MLPRCSLIIVNAISAIILIGLLLISCTDQAKPAPPIDRASKTKLLIFTKTEGFRHASIAEGVAALKQLASENRWEITHTEATTVFTSDSLDSYQAVIFLNTTGDILNQEQQDAFEEFIENGGGFVGIHSATDTEYDWPWYGNLVGAYFESHPQVQEARIEVTDSDHPSTRMLPAEWMRTDEWYNFRDISPEINVLMLLDESTYEGGNNGDYHPIAWYRELEEARMFYTAGGHTAESFSEDLFLEHLEGGISFVLGEP